MAADRAARQPPPIPVAPPQNSMLTDIGHGLARGVAVTAPEMFGKALQAFGADETGKSIADAAAERGKDELYRTTGLAGNVAEMLPVGLGLMGLGAATGGAAAPAIAGAALFGGSQYTQTREKGGDVGQALATGAIQGVGQAIGGAVAGRIATGAAAALQKGALQKGFQAYTDPSLWGTLGRSLIHSEAAQLPTQALAMAGTAAVEQGLPDTPTPWQAAKDSFAPTALLTAAMHPFGAPAIMKTNATRAATAAKIRNDQLPVTDRMRAVHEMARDLRKVDETGTNDWELNALDALSAGVTPELNPDYKYVRGQPAPPEPPPPPALLPTPVRGMSDRTGDIPNEEQRAASADFERQNAELWQRRAETERRQGPFALEPSGGEGDLRLQPEVAGVRGAVFEGGTYGQERPLESPERVPEGQGELDLAPVMNRRPGERPSPLEDAAMAREAADKAAREAPPALTEEPPQTAMAAALQRAGVTPETMQRTQAEAQDAAAVRAQAEADAKKGGPRPVVGQNPELTKVVDPETAARVAAANKLADDAIAGKINGNTPLARQDFAKTWMDVVRESGIKISAKVKNTVLDRLQGKTLYVQQMNELRKARDAMNKTTSTYESLDRLIKRLESFEGPYPKENADGVPAEAAAQVDQRTESQPTADTTGGQDARRGGQDARKTRNAKSGVDVQQTERQGEATTIPTEEVTPPGAPVGYGEHSTRPPTAEELAALHATPAGLEASVNPDATITPEGAKARAEAEAQKLQSAQEAARRADPVHDAAITQAETREAAARAAFEQATPELHDARAQLAVLDARDNALQQMRQRYVELERIRKRTPEQSAEKLQLQARIGEAYREQRKVAEAGTREELQQKISELYDVAENTPELRALSEAVGATEKTRQRGEGEPAATDEYYSFTKGLNAEAGMNAGDNRQRVFNYLEARKYAGTLRELRESLPKDLHGVFDALTGKDSSKGFSADARLGNRAVKVRGTADAALQSMSKDAHKQFGDYVTQLVKSISTAARINEPGKKAEADYARALRQWADIHAKFDYKNSQIEEMSRTGTITPEQAADWMRANEAGRESAQQDFRSKDTYEDLTTKLYTKAYDSYERDIAAADAEKTGLAVINNRRLAAKVAASPNAASVLEHLGRTHTNAAVRAVAKLYAAAKPTAEIKVIEDPDFNGGRYVPATNTIEIGRGGMNTTTMLHEITHALSHAAVTRALANMHKVGLTVKEQQEVAALKTVQDVMKRFEQIADPANEAHMLALKDEHEFLSEGLNNPDLQRLLGAKGWLGKFFDGVRKFFGLPEQAKTDFDALMQAAPTLFGNPNRSLNVVFRDPLNYNVRSPFTAAVSTIRQVSGFDWLNRKIEEVGTKKFVQEQALKTTSLRQQERMLTSTMDRAARADPANEGVYKKIPEAFGKLRDHLSDRSGMHELVMKESDGIANRATKLRNFDRQAMDDVGKMGADAVIGGIDASAKTLAEARQRNPSLTPEKWNSPLAQRLRGEYRRLEGVSAQLRARHGPDTPTPISIYHEMVDHHDLQHTRGTAENTQLMLRAYGMHALDEFKPIFKQLDAREQSGDGAGNIPAKQQQIALDRGITQAMAEVRKIRDREIAAGGPKSKGAYDATALHQMLEEQYANHLQQRQVPYMHLGRAGEHMIMFTIKGGDAEWKRVSDIVTGELKNGGLERGMGPPEEGNRRVYMKFDNISNYGDALGKLKPLLDQSVVHEWADGAIEEKLRGNDAATPRFIKALRDQILRSDSIPEEAKPGVIAQVFDTYFNQLPDNSPMKSSATRDGVNGYSTDYIQSFMDRSKMSAQGLSRLRSSSRIADTLNELGAATKGLREVPGMPDLKAAVGRYAADFRGRVDELNRPVASPVLDRLRALPAVWRLALTPAYVATLMYQPWQLTMPLLGSKFGYAKSLGVMSKNVGLSLAILGKLGKMGWANSEGLDTFTRAASLSNLKLEFSKLTNKDGSPLLTAHQLDLLNHINWQGVFNIGHTNQVARIEPEARFAGSKAYSVASIFPHMAEISNRLITALSAHGLAMERAQKEGLRGEALEEAHRKAKDYAVQMIRESDGDHSAANTARNLGKHGVFGKATPLAVGFQKFFILQTELMLHQMVTLRTGTKAEKIEAGKVLAGVTGMTGLMAGALGLPFMGLASALSNMVQSMFQDPDDTPPDTQLAVRQFLGKLVGGGKAEEVLARGVPRLANIDMSGRAGLQDLAPFTAFLEDRRKMEDSIKDHAFDMMGPLVGMTAGIFTGTHAAMQGNWPKAINDGLPTMLRGYAKAYRQANHGYETTSGANTPIPIAAPTAWDLFTQSQGFAAGHKAEQSERAFQYATNRQLLQRRQQEIRNRIYRAYNEQDWAEVQRLMEDSAHFSMKHNEFHPGVRSGIRQQATSQAVAQATGTGVLGQKRDIRPLTQMYPQMPQLQTQ